MRKIYIYQQDEWPNFVWDTSEILTQLAEVRAMQGKLLGRMSALGFELKASANLETLINEAIKSSEIEGELLNKEQVRSSLAKRLGINLAKPVYANRHIEGFSDMMIDATENFTAKLSLKRLNSWHAALFPTGKSGMYSIVVGKLRNDSTGPMQVVSGAMGKEKVHFQAPDAHTLSAEIKQFLNWFNAKPKGDPVLKAAVAHLWFVTIHPFDDGNGRITRALTEMLLARADESQQRFYSMSTQIMAQRKAYYQILERSQQGGLDITPWILWFLNCLKEAISAASQNLNRVLFKHDFWLGHGVDINNERQKLVLNKLLDGFEGKLNTSKWAKITKCSTDTALRDIQDLEKKGILEKEPGGGRSTSYKIKGHNS